MIETQDLGDGRYITTINKINELVEQSNRQDAAIENMAVWLVQAQTGFGAIDQENIFKILRGESNTEKADLGEAKNG